MATDGRSDNTLENMEMWYLEAEPEYLEYPEYSE